MVSRLFSYPQGEGSIVPQILAFMALIATCLALPVFDENDNDFMCIVRQVGTTREYLCSPLYLNDPSYWTNEDTRGWAGAIQSAALFAIVTATLGFVSFALLISASCFHLKPRRLLSVAIMQGVCVLCSIFTLIAGAADICKLAGVTSCNKESVHVEQGAGAMIFAFFFYISACIFTSMFFLRVRREFLDSDRTSNKNEDTNAIADVEDP